MTRKRYSVTSPGEVTGYAVGLPHHTAKDGGTVWYGGGKLAADLTLPKLRRRWAATGADAVPFPGHGIVPGGGPRRAPEAWSPARREQARDEAGFFARLRDGWRAGAAAVQRR